MAFRDHLGFGPVFYRRDARGVYVASEAKQIVAGAGIAEEPDLDVCEEIYFRTYDENTPSALRGVERLPKASVLLADGSGSPGSGAIGIRPSGSNPGATGPEEIKERFDHLMEPGGRQNPHRTGRRVAEWGIDSPAVAAYGASRHLEIEGRRLGGVSAVYPDFPAVDESEYTRSGSGPTRDAPAPLPAACPTPRSARRMDPARRWTRAHDLASPVRGALQVRASSSAIARC